MKTVYKWFGGRKIVMFLLLLFVNSGALYIGKWTSEFGTFCVFMYGVIVVGVESNKVIKGKFKNEN